MSSISAQRDDALLTGNQEKRPLLRDTAISVGIGHMGLGGPSPAGSVGSGSISSGVGGGMAGCTNPNLSRRDKSPSSLMSNSDNHHQKTIVQIPLPAPERAEPRYPAERRKTLVAFLFSSLALVINLIVLAYVHERVPDRRKVPPLPDIFFDLFAPVDWALDVSEVMIIASVWTCILLMVLHRYRWIVFRRVFAIMGVLYAMRAITMLVTQVPIASTTYYCSPKANSTSPLVIAKRVLQLFSGFGLSINGQHTYCGDYIFSGHTLILTLCYLVVQEYSPQRCKLLHLLFFCTSSGGVFMVLLARGHYLVDVVLGYYVTTRVFWIYHSLAASLHSSKGHVGSSQTALNYLSRVWWFSFFRYFEKNVTGAVPRQYEWPLPWPRKWIARTRIS